MANKTVSNLNELTTVSNSDVLLVETSTETLKVTKGNLLKEVNEQLNTKSNVNHTHDEYVTESELNAKGLATETFVTNKIAEASLSGGDVDLSGYATKDELNTKVNVSDLSNVATSGDYNDLINVPTIPTVDVTKEYVDTQLLTKANITDIPTKVSELTNDSGYLTVIPEEYVTDTELESKGYLTEHQDISNLATKAEVQTKADVNHIHSQYLTTIPTEYITETELADALSTKANTSDIPSLEGYATETYVTNKIAEASLSGGEVDLSGYATKDELNVKADLVHTHTMSDITDLSIPTNTSDLTNDSGFITVIPDEYVTEVELIAKGYLVPSDISGKANISDLSAVATTGDYNDLINKPTITNGATFTPNVDTDGNLSWTNDKELENPTTINIKGAKGDKGEQGEKGADGKDGQDGLTTSISLNGTVYSHVDGTITLPDYPTIPTKTSDLINDSEFLTSIPAEYITEAKLNEKGYLTEHQDISGKANISDLSAVATSGDYNDLINTPTIPNEYILPIASATTLGGIKVGSGLSIDRYGVLSATGTGGTGTGGTGTGGTAGNGIIFNNSYIADCNRWLSNGYVKTGTSTLNLPTLCTGVDRWGILFFIAENATNGTGTQMYFPVDGAYKGRVFTRSLTAMNQSGGRTSEWVLLTIQSDIPTLLSQLTNDSGFVKASELSPVALSGNYNDLINKPTISGGGNVSSEAVINTKSITIDLDKYGIVEGDLSHKAPYSDEEYEIAYNNMEGFKTALNDLSSQGYSKIYLPRGTYIMCYRNPTGTNVWSYNRGWEITIPSHTDFDLNGSTIRVIYDSNNKKPYHIIYKHLR